MTEEEARAEREEAERLLAEIIRLQNQIERAIIENQNLQAELAVSFDKHVAALKEGKRN